MHDLIRYCALSELNETCAKKFKFFVRKYSMDCYSIFDVINQIIKRIFFIQPKT